MSLQFNKTDYWLWSIIVIYTGIIYATLSIVSKVRKSLTEKFGPDVFDHFYWFFGIVAVFTLFYCFRKFRGKSLLRKLTIVVVISSIYAYYLSGMKYPVERIHFLEYGLLGALTLAAFNRHVKNWISVILSLNLVYWIGLGDEAIQGILPSRVGEIRDSIINLFSGALGIALYRLVSDAFLEKQPRTSKQRRTSILFIGATVLFTSLFIFKIHGFGYTIKKKDPGIIYSSLTWSQLNRINKYADNISEHHFSYYNNEALRHLFLREYYFTNNYKASNGSYYKNYYGCFVENRILEVFYARFLKEHATESSGMLIAGIDWEVAERVVDNQIMWSDSLRLWVKSFTPKTEPWIFTSRVKSGIITSFTLKDLLFYCILIYIVLGYLWFQVPKKEEHL